MTNVTGAGVPAPVCPICDGATAAFRQGLYDDRYGHPGLYDARRCRVCGHVFLDTAFTDEALGRLYSDWYPRATRHYAELPPLARTSGFAAWLNGERHAAHSWVPRNVSVLDIGCGFGQTLALHESRGCRAVGVEADENAVSEAQAQGLTVLHGLFDPSRHDPASFDYVTMDQVLEHARLPIDFMRGVASVLKDGGVAVISTPNAGGYGMRVFGERWINWHVPYHLNLFTRASLRRLARETGFEVRSIRTTTASAWLRYQWLANASRPAPGASSSFWDPKRASDAGRPLKRARRWAKRLDRVHAFQLVTRAVDSLGIGDNMVAVLVKPAPA